MMVAEVSGPVEGDAFGEALLDRLNGASAPIIVERDDGLLEVDGHDYVGAWSDRDAWAAEQARGRVLDVGAGAGRATLALRARGHEVVALDTSPGAIEACRRRGLTEVFPGTVEDLAAAGEEPFDTALMLGNNLGLLGSPERAGEFFAALGAVLRPGGVVVGTGLDPYQTDRRAHLDYHEANRRRRRLPGQLSIRVRYERLATPWFDLLWLSPHELAEMAGRSGWQVAGMCPGTLYGAVLTRA